MSERIYYENVEGLAEWNIPPAFWENRLPGLSAMMRVKNEGDFLEYSVRSIIDWHDEVCLFIQGEQEDSTWDVARRLHEEFPDKVKLYHYPFESVVNGPNHLNQQRGSVYERAYFYNWCLAHTSREYVNKWDGDMIAEPTLAPLVKGYLGVVDGIYFTGRDMVGKDIRWESRKNHTASEQRIHRVTESSFYFTHTHCEHLSISALDEYRNNDTVVVLKGFQFMHLKWCKSSLKYSGVGWPEDWMDADPYYRGIYYNKGRGKLFRGPYPPAIRPYLRRLKGSA